AQHLCRHHVPRPCRAPPSLRICGCSRIGSDPSSESVGGMTTSTTGNCWQATRLHQPRAQEARDDGPGASPIAGSASCPRPQVASPMSGPGRTRRPRWACLVVWLGVTDVLLHTFVIATWVGPSTPVREAIGTDTLRSYVHPVFDQSWRIFAPTPRRVAVNFQ